MDKYTSTLLPYVLEMLSRQPQLRITTDFIEANIRDSVMNEHVSPFGTLKHAVDFAIEVGHNLGILNITNEEVQIPLSFRRRISSQGSVPPEASITPAQARKLIKQRMPKPRATATRKPKKTTSHYPVGSKGPRGVPKANPKRRS
ncbi:hypothetical protein KR067_013720 [Drosophila pandora]|nr:hypothetical protein KR067_013720 [Drosophila pandora]